MKKFSLVFVFVMAMSFGLSAKAERPLSIDGMPMGSWSVRPGRTGLYAKTVPSSGFFIYDTKGASNDWSGSTEIKDATGKTVCSGKLIPGYQKSCYLKQGKYKIYISNKPSSKTNSRGNFDLR